MIPSLASFHIELRHLTGVGFHPFGQEVHRKTLLKQGIALILLISRDAVDSGLAPFCLPEGVGMPLASRWRQMPAGGLPSKQSEDEPDDHGFFFINYRLPVLALLVAQKMLVGHADLTVCKPFPLPQVTFSEMLRLSS